MNDISIFFATLLGSYLIGAIPFGLVLARLVKGVDLRQVGSKNIGATNAGRAMGRRWALVVFLLDMAKGLGPALVGGAMGLAGAPGAWLAPCCGLAAILGHCFPIYLRFRGGKGVATTVGALLALDPIAALISGGVWVIAVLLWRYVSLASMLMGAAFPIAVLVRSGAGGERLPLLLVTVVVAVLICIRHHSNLRRLLTGNENRVGRK